MNAIGEDTSRVELKAAVDAHFEANARFWDDIYQDSSPYALIHQDRRALALAWIDRLRLPPGAPVLEIGCGAGLLSIALAQRGLAVVAIDPAEQMLHLAHQHAATVGVAERIRFARGDVHALELADETFRLVVALGVIPWLHSPTTALREMVRVTEAGGYLLMTADNRARLSSLLDPRYSPISAPAKRAVKWLLERAELRRGTDADPGMLTSHSLGELDRMLEDEGLTTIARVTLGFGPFTLFGRECLPPRVGRVAHRALQRLANRGVPGLRSTGAQYVVLARKRVPTVCTD